MTSSKHLTTFLMSVVFIVTFGACRDRKTSDLHEAAVTTDDPLLKNALRDRAISELNVLTTTADVRDWLSRFDKLEDPRKTFPIDASAYITGCFQLYYPHEMKTKEDFPAKLLMDKQENWYCAEFLDRIVIEVLTKSEIFMSNVQTVQSFLDASALAIESLMLIDRKNGKAFANKLPEISIDNPHDYASLVLAWGLYLGAYRDLKGSQKTDLFGPLSQSSLIYLRSHQKVKTDLYSAFAGMLIKGLDYTNVNYYSPSIVETLLQFGRPQEEVEKTDQLVMEPAGVLQAVYESIASYGPVFRAGNNSDKIFKRYYDYLTDVKNYFKEPSSSPKKSIYAAFYGGDQVFKAVLSGIENHHVNGRKNQNNTQKIKDKLTEIIRLPLDAELKARITRVISNL